MRASVRVILASLLLAVPAHADTLKNVLSRLQQRYDGTNTMQADFRQTVESKTLAGTLESKGKVSFEKPNRMRWDYDPPDPQTIVGDGETLWIYQPDLKQVIKAPLGALGHEAIPRPATFPRLYKVKGEPGSGTSRRTGWRLSKSQS